VAALIHKAIGDQLTCIFVDNGLLRRDEPERVVETFDRILGIKLVHVDATERFYFPETETLGGLSRHTEFVTYSSFGWRRLSLLRALPSNSVSLGPLGYLFENPHALLACVYFLSSAAGLALAALLMRRLPRRAASAAREGFVVPAALKGEGA
jgi:hypothetical protein